MGKRVNIVLPGGEVVSVDEDKANEGTYRRESAGEVYNTAKGRAREEEHGGVLSTVVAGVEGAVDAATLGIGGKIAKKVFGDEYAHDYESRAQEHPIARGLGELSMSLAPTGLLGSAAKAVGGATLMGQANRLGKLGTAGVLGEGAVVGIGAQIASTNVTGDPLTIEGVVTSAGIGSLLNYGISRVGGGLTKWGKSSQAAKAEAEELSALAPDAAKGHQVLSESNPHYDGFVSAVKAQKEAEQTAFNQVKKANDKYKAWVESTEKFGETISDFQKAQNKIRVEFAQRSALKDMDWMRDHNMSFDDMLAQKEMASEFLDKMQLELDEAIKMRRAAGRPGGADWQTNADAATAKLMGVRGKLSQTFPSVPVPDIPLMPPPMSAVNIPLAVELPKNLRAFARMTPPKIAELAKALDDDAAVAFAHVAKDLDVGLKSTPGDTLASVHARLGDYTKAIERMEAKAATEAAKDGAGGFMDYVQRAGKRAAVGAAGFGVFQKLGGGMLGAGGGGAARVMVGGAMDAVEDSLLGGVLVQGKQGIRTAIRDVVSKYGVPVGTKLDQLAPVTSYISRSFPDNTPDTSRDVRKQAASRALELQAAASGVSNAMFLAVESVLGHPGDIGYKVASHVANAVTYLAAKAPRDPGTNIKMFRSDWLPSWKDAVEFAHRFEAVMAPMVSLSRALAGNGHPAATEALWTVFPAMMNEMAQEVSMISDQLRNLTYKQVSAYSQLFKTPLTGLQNPNVFIAIQGMYLPPPEAAGPSAGGQPGFGRNPSGRPASVGANPVAGSSVSGLQNSQ